jgi:hypothetical protein
MRATLARRRRDAFHQPCSRQRGPCQLQLLVRQRPLPGCPTGDPEQRSPRPRSSSRLRVEPIPRMPRSRMQSRRLSACVDQPFAPRESSCSMTAWAIVTNSRKYSAASAFAIRSRTVLRLCAVRRRIVSRSRSRQPETSCWRNVEIHPQWPNPPTRGRRHRRRRPRSASGTVSARRNSSVAGFGLAPCLPNGRGVELQAPPLRLQRSATAA